MRTVSVREGHKWCPGCRKEIAFELFVKNHRNKLGLDAYCKECVRRKSKRYFKSRNITRSFVKARLIIEFGNRCKDCGITDLPISAFVFHHHSESMKSEAYMQPSAVIARANVNLLLKERAKWALLCANCHQIRHGGLANVSATKLLQSVHP